MMCKRNKEDGHWDAFTKWALECGINMEHEDDWGWAWWCWNAALDAREEAEAGYPNA